jgi:hypothetical protein
MRVAILLAGFAVAGCAAPVVTLPGDSPSSIQTAGLFGDDEDVAYVCPMHADYTSDAEGKCPRCGMALVKATPFDMRDYRLDFQTMPAIPKAGEPLTLNFKIFHPSTGEPVKKFELVHDRAYHLFVISQDMQFFEHIHPEENDEGAWSITVTLPSPGYYEVLSDFMPSGGSAQFLARPLVTAGYTGDLLTDSAHLIPDASRSQTVDDLTATVDFDPKPFVSGSYGHMTFRLKRAGSDEPVRDLQTYLGAFGHTLIMSEDLVNYVHSHPVDNLPANADLETVRGGPDIMFEALMPKPGRYRAWTQFRYHDKIHTFITTFEVYDIGQRVSD